MISDFNKIILTDWFRPKSETKLSGEVFKKVSENKKLFDFDKFRMMFYFDFDLLSRLLSKILACPRGQKETRDNAYPWFGQFLYLFFPLINLVLDVNFGHIYQFF